MSDREMRALPGWQVPVIWTRAGRHRPDLGVTANGGRVAVEVELTAKAHKRLHAILAGYRQTIGTGRLVGVLYVVEQPLMRAAVEREAHTVGLDRRRLRILDLCRGPAGHPAARRHRTSAPPPPPDVLGPVLRLVILAAAFTGIRQSELLGLRWRDVGWGAQRLRVRNAWVRGEHSSEGKSVLSTRRSVSLADRLVAELDRWSKRSAYTAADDLVFGHPQTGRPLDRSKVTRRFQAACVEAGVEPIRFHDLRGATVKSCG